MFTNCTKSTNRLRKKPIIQAVILGLLLFSGNLLIAQCCTDNLISDSGFETSFTSNENFPYGTGTNNAQTFAPAQWFYADGTNSLNPTIIADPTRASSGNQFGYVPVGGVTPAFNRCIGNGLSHTSNLSTCTTDRYTSGIRYVVQFDYVPFNPSVPAGGTGSTRPHFEFQSPFTPVDLYSSGGTLITTNETAVDWDDVASSWNTCYGVTPVITDNNGITTWYSHDINATCGMLIDNASFTPLVLSAATPSNIAQGGSNTEVTFTLNPTSNVGPVPNINYSVSAPSGYSISPTQGTYGSNTTFTLTINSGTMLAAPGTFDVSVYDQGNTSCTVSSVVTNVWLPDTDSDGIPDIDDIDDDNDGIPDEIEDCGSVGGGTTDIDIEIQLDDYPGETSWTLRDAGNNIVASGGSYTTSNQLIEVTYAAAPGTYSFNIQDTWGDGLTITGGYYQVSVDGSVEVGPISNSFSNSTHAITVNENTFTCLSGNPNGDDDNDGTLNYADSDFCTLNSNGVCASIDLDGDGVINSMDLDADNDGIPDLVEAGGTDSNNDGEVDYPTPGDATSMTDVDNDGLMDALDDQDSGAGGSEVTSGTALAMTNTDGAGNPDYLDIDADDDGIVDNTEAQSTSGYVAPSGTDTDGDGLDDAYDTDCAPCGGVTGVAIVTGEHRWHR